MNELENLRIASPCLARWNEMAGDEKVRFCASCRKSVYNLSAMTRGEAEELITAREGRLCALMYRRADGTVLTADCPVGRRRKMAKGLRRVAAAIGAAVAVFGGQLFTARPQPDSPSQAPASTAGAQPAQAAPNAPAHLDDETRELLGSLGYIG
jgi:hypothetical protein